MDKELTLKQLNNRKKVILNRGKYSDGIIRKLNRQIRNLQK